MTNEQKPERSIDHIELHHAWETIQGEGPFAGTPCVFVRLAGCNLQCPMCDTDYTSQRKEVTGRQLLNVVQKIRSSGLVVITGGEPLRQNITPALWIMLQHYKVQVETNGSIGRKLPGSVTIVCSPKTGKLNHDFVRLNRIDAFKYVLKAGEIDEKDGLPTKTLGYDRPPARPVHNAKVYVQPMDEFDAEKNKENLDACIASVFKYGYTLSLQTHKMIGME